MKRILMGFAASALLLTGCSTNEILDNGTTTPENAIGFGVYAGKQTKAGGSFVTGTSLPDQSAFGVFAFNTGTSSGVTTASPNFMFDQKVDVKGSSGTQTFEYSPLKYWPSTNGTEDKVSFIAYYPHKATGLSTTYKNTSTGLPTFEFTVQSAAADQVDLMSSDLLSDKTKSNETVAFSFKHALAQINFSANMSAALDAGTTVTVTSVQLIGVNSKGTFSPGTTLWSGQDTPVGFSVSMTSIKFESKDGVTAKDITQNDADKFLMIPQTLPEGAKIVVGYTVTTTDAALNKAVTFDKTAEVAINGTSWAANNKIRYTLSMSLDKVDLSGNAVGWDGETARP